MNKNKIKIIVGIKNDIIIKYNKKIFLSGVFIKIIFYFEINSLYQLIKF